MHADELAERAGTRAAAAADRVARDAEVVRRVAAGERQAAVARDLGLSTGRVSQIVIAARA